MVPISVTRQADLTSKTISNLCGSEISKYNKVVSNFVLASQLPK